MISETAGGEAKKLLSDESRDEFKIASVSEKKKLVTGFIGSLQYAVPSEVFESEVSIVNNF